MRGPRFRGSAVVLCSGAIPEPEAAMRPRTCTRLLMALGWLATAAWPIAAASIPPTASENQAGPDLVKMSYRGTSLPVGTLPPAAPGSEPKRWLGELERDADRERFVFDEHGVRYGTGRQKMDDTLVLPPRSDGEPDAPDLLVDFAGLSSTIQGPPDPEGAVGPDHYVQAVNI